MIPIRIFCQNINRDMLQISKNHMENPFNERCKKVFKNEYFSMIRMNIRSLPANLNHFMNYLNCWMYSFLCCVLVKRGLMLTTVTSMHSQGTVMLVNTALIGLVVGCHYLSRILFIQIKVGYIYIQWYHEKVCLWRWIYLIVMDVKQW